jgi:hypothetical protein
MDTFIFADECLTLSHRISVKRARRSPLRKSTAKLVDWKSNSSEMKGKGSQTKEEGKRRRTCYTSCPYSSAPTMHNNSRNTIPM